MPNQKNPLYRKLFPEVPIEEKKLKNLKKRWQLRCALFIVYLQPSAKRFQKFTAYYFVEWCDQIQRSFCDQGSFWSATLWSGIILFWDWLIRDCFVVELCTQRSFSSAILWSKIIFWDGVIRDLFAQRRSDREPFWHGTVLLCCGMV